MQWSVVDRMSEKRDTWMGEKEKAFYWEILEKWKLAFEGYFVIKSNKSFSITFFITIYF